MPSSLPPSCPPSGASATTGTYYRLVQGDLSLGAEPDDSDWVLPVYKRKGECAGRDDVCECFAHSVFADLEDAMQARLFVPQYGKKAIAEVSVSPAMGVLMHTPAEVGESHHDWWASPISLKPIAKVVVEKPVPAL